MNHDVTVMLHTQVTTGAGRRQKKEWKYVWRIGNIVGLRQLKVEPNHRATEEQLASSEVLTVNPKSLSIHDPAAVLTLRWYHESNAHGDVLLGFQNKACKGWYHLPTSGEAHVEPVELVPNHAVIESVKMSKVLGHVGVWQAERDHITCTKKKLKSLVQAEQPKCKVRRCV